MSENEVSSLSLKELANRMDPNGTTARIAEVLTQKNQILEDIPWLESNETFSNRTVRRSSVPAGTFRKLNYGVAYHASKTTPMVDVIGMLEDYSKVDYRLVEAAPSPGEFRSQEDMAFVAGFGKTIAYNLVYGNTSTDPEKFTGLAARMDALADSNVIDGGGSGSDTTSIYVVTWGRDTVHGIYGRGSKAGLSMEDKGKVLIEASSLANQWYVSHFRWECGLVVRDPRCIGRVANIETSGTSNIFDEDDLIDLLSEYMELGPTTRIYVPRRIMSQMWKRLKDKNNVYFSRTEGLDAGGMPISFNGIPIRIVEQISLTETAIA